MRDSELIERLKEINALYKETSNCKWKATYATARNEFYRTVTIPEMPDEPIKPQLTCPEPPERTGILKMSLDEYKQQKKRTVF